MADALTDRELQSLRNMGNESERAADEIERLRAEAEKLRTVMVAAAEEIAAHWQAHCDAEGYGPANLQRRLEEGIPSEYGYTAGAFAELKAERDRLRAALAAAPAAPAGWQLVPVEPTPEMVHALADNVSLFDFERGARIGYRAALAAAPTHTGDAHA